MPISNLKLFSVLVIRPTGLPFEGARLRVLNAANEDKTLAFLGNTVVVTDATGKFVRLLQPNALPAGIYTIEVTAPGYLRTTATTLGAFTGEGVFVLHPVAITELSGYAIEIPAAAYLSPMAPVRLVVTAPDPDAMPWQLIQTTIVQGDREVLAESPVDPISGDALIPVRNRVQLLPRPNLVPDGDTFRVDPDFSGKVELSFSAITDEGTYPTDLEPVELMFANIYPSGNTNDLTPYTNAIGLAKWITPFSVVPVFRGYYADVMVWLPNVAPGDTVMLWRSDFDSAGNPLVYFSPPTPVGLFTSKQVIRVRLRVPDNSAVRSTYLFQKNSVTVTETLNVQYR